jgi:hypothetical protein
MNDPRPKLPQKTVVASDIAKELDRLEDTVVISGAKDVKPTNEQLKKTQANNEPRPTIKINPLRQTVSFWFQGWVL